MRYVHYSEFVLDSFNLRINFKLFQQSNARITVDNGRDINDRSVVTAVIHVFNAKDLSIHGIINGINTNYLTIHNMLPSRFRAKIFSPWAFSLILANSASTPKSSKNSFCDRQIGDKLLHFESKTSRKTNRFDEVQFDYTNETTFITRVETTTNVSLNLIFIEIID